MPKSPAPENKLPVKESPKWLVFEYRMQKMGGVALAIIVCLGLAGVFSDGIFSTARISDPGNRLSVEYERVSRIDSDMNIKIEVQPDGESISLALGGDWMAANEVKTLFPQAERMTSQNGALRIEYRTHEVSRPFAIWLGVTPRAAGLQHYTLQTGGNTLAFNQFILP